MKRYEEIRVFKHGAGNLYKMLTAVAGDVFGPKESWVVWRKLDHTGWTQTKDFVVGTLEEILQIAHKFAEKVEVFDHH